MTRPHLRLVGGCDFVPRTQSTSAVQVYKQQRASKKPNPITTTDKNRRLRQRRREAWRIADVTRGYWRARLDFERAIEFVQSWELPEGRLYPAYDQGKDWQVLASWREAVVKQLLTPAPDIAAVNWKKATFARGQHRYTDVDPKRIERAIKDDLAFLAAHPTRGSIPAKRVKEEV
jgi:hypothetical protein